MRSVRAIVVAGLAGQLSAAVVGILPWAVLPLSAALLVLAVQSGLRCDEARAVLLRRGASVAAVVVAVVGLPGIVTVTDPAQLKSSLGLVLVGVQICQAVGWRQPREQRAGVLTALGVLVLAASYAPDVLVGLPLVVGWVAILVALGQLNGATLKQAVPPAALAVVLGLVAFLLLPAPVSAGVRSRLAGGAGAKVVSRGDAGAAAFSGGRLDLRARGALSADPVLEVPNDSPTLWRSTTYDTYDGTAWAAPHSGAPVGRTAAGFEVSTPLGPTRTDRAELRTGSAGAVWSPGLVTTLSASGELAFSAEPGEVVVPGIRGSYSVTTEPPVTSPARLRSTTGADQVDTRWRNLPTDLPGRVTALAEEITQGSHNRFDASEAIASWLREHATYRLDSPVPTAGQDAVDRFLFVDRTGFCEQFASAEAVLLRAVGIPARLVTGLAYGADEGDHRLYRVKDLHAWVELWVPGTGWVTSDPTAGVPLAPGGGSGQASLRSRASAAITSALRSLTRIPGGRPALAATLLLATGVVIVLAAARRRRRPPALAQKPGTTGPALAAFLRFDARQGALGRRPGESLTELRVRVPQDVAAALEVVELECYAPVVPDPAEAVTVLDRS